MIVRRSTVMFPMDLLCAVVPAHGGDRVNGYGGWGHGRQGSSAETEVLPRTLLRDFRCTTSSRADCRTRAQEAVWRPWLWYRHGLG